MIECGICPDNRVVTEFAGGGEASRRVGRVGGSRVILLMARIARRAVERVIAIDVAIAALARRDRVGAGQREAG